MGQPERERKERERENYPTKSPNLSHCWAHSQNKGPSEYQRRASRYRPSHHPPEAGRQAGDSQSQKGATLAPETASSTKLRAGSQLLTKTSWDSGQLTSTGMVAARDQLPRGDTQHTCRGHAHYTPRKPSGWDGGGVRRYPTWGECARQAPGRLSCSDLGRAQNTDPTKSVPLWSTQEVHATQGPL